MPVLALQGIRGGIGTTSVIAALAWALQQLDESVLVIDFSPDNLLRLHFNMHFEQSRGGLGLKWMAKAGSKGRCAIPRNWICYRSVN
ncbi:cellulose synthase [Yersinia enterocolitica]|nr:cellulose synthase [Yersinia enterocolitica]